MSFNSYCVQLSRITHAYSRVGLLNVYDFKFEFKLTHYVNSCPGFGSNVSCSMAGGISFEVSLSLNCTDLYKREGGA